MGIFDLRNEVFSQLCKVSAGVLLENLSDRELTVAANKGEISLD